MMTKRLLCSLILILGVVGILRPLASATAETPPKDFTVNVSTSRARIKVFCYRPSKIDRVVVLMHGVKRNPGAYRDAWTAAAERYNLFLIAPLFDKSQFPGGAGYSRGNVRNNKSINRESLWNFGVVDQVFTEIRTKYQLKAQRYYLFGHSAGAQFVHRKLLLSSSKYCHSAIAANAGWYAFPTVTQKYPYGLGAIPDARSRLSRGLRTPLIIMLGGDDRNPEAKYLRQTRRAKKQGKHRLERGQSFVKAGRKQGARWKVEVVFGVGHNFRAMSVAAARHWFGRKP